MKEIFMFSFNAVMPILLTTVSGYIIRLTGLFDDAFFKKANSLVFKVFLPVLLFKNVYDIGSLGDINVPSLVYCALSVLALAAVGYGCAVAFIKNRRQKGVIAQSVFRSNYAYIGIPLAESIAGAAAVSYAGIVSAVTIPIFNILAVILLSHYSEDKEADLKDTLRKVVKNPLIRAILTGIAVLVIRELLPAGADGEIIFSVKRDLPFIYSTIANLSKIASPFALVVLGARFDFKAVKSLIKPICLGTALRLVVSPVVGIGCAVVLAEKIGVLSLSSTEYPALIALFSTPVAVSSAVMTGEIGGDEQLANQLVVWTSLLSVVTMFIAVFLMRSAALI